MTYVLYILAVVKAIMYTNITNVVVNKLLVYSVTSMITVMAVGLITSTRFKRKEQISLAVYAIISVLMFMDVIYYTYFNTLPSVVMLGQASQLADVADIIKSLVTIKTVVMVLDVPLLVMYTLIVSAKEKTQKDSEAAQKITENIKVNVIITIITFTMLLNTFIFTGIKGQLGTLTAQEFYTYHYTDLINYLKGNVQKGLETVDSELIEELKDRARLKEGKFTGVGRGKNLIVLQVEALQNFVLNLEYEGQEITPNLNKLLRDQTTLYYDRYYQQVGRGNTSDAEFVSNNSLYPSMVEPTYTQYVDNKFYGLPWLLRDNGYSTQAFHGYEKSFWNRDNAYVSQGYEKFISQENFEFTEKIGWGITDSDFFKQSVEHLKELDNRDNPFYAFMVTLTSHAPFKMPVQHEGIQLNDKHKETPLGNYLQAINYTDSAIGEFIQSLKDEGMYDNTVIAIYGDHFGMLSSLKDHRDLMEDFLGTTYDFDGMMNIPLIISIPGTNINETIHAVGSHIDFYPTIQNIMGYDNTKGLIMGRDLNNYEGYKFVAPLTHMIKGSIIDEDYLVEMSRDGIYSNSRAIDIRTKEKIDAEILRDKHEIVLKEINTSNYILKNDTLNTEKSKTQLVNIYGKIYYNNKLDSKRNKLTIVEADGLDISQLGEYMKVNPENYLILRSEDYLEKFKLIKDTYPEYNSRLIPEITSFGHYNDVTNRGYHNVILNVTSGNYTEDQIIEYLKNQHHIAIVINKDQIGIIGKVNTLGVKIIVEDENIKTRADAWYGERN